MTVGAGLAEGDGAGLADGDGVGTGTGTGLVDGPRIGARAASFAASGVRQSVSTRPPVMPEFGLKDQYA